MSPLILLSLTICIAHSTQNNNDDNNDESTVADEIITYGVCYQFNTTNGNNPQIIPSTENQAIIFTEYGFNALPDTPIQCIWYPSNQCAQCASTQQQDTQSIQHTFLQNQNDIQISSYATNSLIECHNRFISIAQQRDVVSNHLCSTLCTDTDTVDEEDSFCSTLIQSRNAALASYELHTNITPFMPSMFGISGICIAFIVVAVFIYAFGVKYSQWTMEKSGNETERAIGDVLDEIAKYTIGDEDEDEGFYDYANSDETDSTFSDEEELGMAILRVVSCQNGMGGTPELHPNPSILLSSGTDSDESDDEQCRLDVLAAKQTLYATSHGTTNPYLHEEEDDEEEDELKLDSVTITVQSKEQTLENYDTSMMATPNEPLLSGCGSGNYFSDYKMSSDAANNSDLP